MLISGGPCSNLLFVEKGDPWELEGSSPRTEGFALSSFERTVKTKIQTVYYHERYYPKTTFDS